jgi:DNA modification methylase
LTDIYTGVNTIYCAESTQFIKENIPNNFIDLIVTSPPYFDIRKYNGYTLDLIALGQQCFHALKDGGVLAMVIQDGTKNFAKSLTSFRTAVQFVDQIGFQLFECVIYQRPGKPGAWWSKRFRVDHEYIMIFFKGKRPKHFDKKRLLIPAKHAGKVWSGTQRLTSGELISIKETEQKPLKCPGTIWPIRSSNSEGNKLKMLHPATFPDDLAEKMILCFTEPGDLVIDPMCGSGTTCRMAKKNGRNYVGIDISSQYCEWAREGLEEEPSPASE